MKTQSADPKAGALTLSSIAAGSLLKTCPISHHIVIILGATLALLDTWAPQLPTEHRHGGLWEYFLRLCPN